MDNANTGMPIESLPYPTLLLDRDSRILACNLLAAELLRCARQDLIGHLARDFVRPGSSVDPLWQGQPGLAEGEMEWLLGAEKMLLQARIFWESERAILTLQDLRSQKRRQRAMDIRDAFRQAIMDSTVYAIVSTDVEGMILSFNRAAEKVFGRAALDVIGGLMLGRLMGTDDGERNFGGQSFLPQQPGEMREAIWSCSLGDRIHQVQFTINRVEVEGQLQGFVLVAVDVSDKMRIENRLNMLSAAMDQHVIVSISDVKGDISYVNQRFCQVSGWSQDELLGKNHRLLQSSIHSPEFYAELWQTVLAGKVWQGEICNRRKEEGFYWLSTTIIPVFGDGGQVEQFIAISTEITAIKEGEVEMAKAKEAAEQSNRAKTVFLASMSHEVRTPMNAILGHAQLLRHSRNLDPSQCRGIEAIARSGEHLLGIINEILEISRIEAGCVVLSPQPVDLGRMIGELEQMFAPRARTKGILLELINQTRPGVAIVLDEAKIRQILVNLIGNAVKFTDHGGICLIAKDLKTGDPARRRIAFSVSDTGIGISEELQSRLFTKFEQSEEGRMRGGTGLGLVISREYAHMMNGDIVVTSQPGVGSTFVCEIEGAADVMNQSYRAAPEVLRVLDPAQGEVRVLVIDDNPDNLEVLRSMLERVGCSVRTADGVSTGLSLTRQWQPKAILLDWVMPDGGGAAFLAARATLPPCRIIVATASVLSTQYNEILIAGADDFIAKPILIPLLCSKLAKQCDLKFIVEEEPPEVAADDEEGLDPEILKQLNEVVQIGSLRQVKIIAGQIKGSHPYLAAELNNAADDFDLKALMVITQRLLKS
jgi:PAS domain S-box-containing protein